MTLVAGKMDVIDVSPTTFTANNLDFFGGVVPSATTPVILYLTTGGAYTFPQIAGLNSPNSANPNTYAPYILFNYAFEGCLELGSGPETGNFTVEKRLDGTAAGDAAVTRLTFTYNYTVNGAAQTALEVTGEGAAISPQFPVGATVVITEATVTPPDGTAYTGVAWEGVGSSFTIEAAGTTRAAIAINTFNIVTDPVDGAFTLAKTLVNRDGVSWLPASYAVQYRLDGGVWVDVPLVAGVSPVVIDGLAVGTAVAVREIAPAPIAGATWATVVVSSASFTITAAEQTTPRAVVVTNTIRQDVVEGPTFNTHAHVGATPNGVLSATNWTVTYHVFFSGFTIGETYTLEGELVYIEEGQVVKTGITGTIVHQATAASGTFYSDFTLTDADLARLAGKKLSIRLSLPLTATF